MPLGLVLGNMICQFAEINNEHIECVLDNNEKKVGKIMTGSNIPIVNEDEWIDNLTNIYLFCLTIILISFPNVSKHITIGEINI